MIAIFQTNQRRLGCVSVSDGILRPLQPRMQNIEFIP